MFAANIKEHNASQVYTEMFVFQIYIIKKYQMLPQLSKKQKTPPAHHQPSLHVGLSDNETDKAIQKLSHATTTMSASTTAFLFFSPVDVSLKSDRWKKYDT